MLDVFKRRPQARPAPAATAGERKGFVSRYVSADDGLLLHARDYGPRAAPQLPALCLPGLTRAAADFHELATALAADRNQPRRVIAVDYRGRGLSQRDPDWRNYDVRIEAADVLAMADALGVGRAVVIGTSRGGLLAMALAAMRPGLLAGVVLNDIGPRIETQGLLRIRSYVGRLPEPHNWTDAAEILRRLSDGQFPKLDAAAWMRQAKASFIEERGRIVPSYDPALMKTLEGFDLEKPLPELWHLFEGLGGIPVLAIRGENSDLMASETLTEMAMHHAELETYVVADQGHAPLLTEESSIARIAAFAARCDGRARLG